MNKQIVTCAQCGAQEEYDMKPGFPKKYCSPCGTARKVLYEAKQNGYTVANSKDIDTVPNIAQAQAMADLGAMDASKTVAGVYNGEPKMPKAPKQTIGYDTNERIAAQVILKGAVELIIASTIDDKSGEVIRSYLGEQLGEAVNELTGAYKLALNNMKNLSDNE